VEEYQESLRLKPDPLTSLNDPAWELDAAANNTLRNGTEAVALAERACQLTQFQELMFVGTLAASYAEAGRFPDAVKIAGKAIDLATTAGQAVVAEKNRQLIELYRAGKPFHETRQQ
jgi:tetratricopeptide (TPR) repeat protein